MDYSKQNSPFVATHWSMVFDAARSAGPTQALARGRLYEDYRLPLVAHINRLGHSAMDSEDLCQGFFEYLLTPDREFFAKADPAKGKLRTFLLGALDHFLNNHRRKANAQKRGAGVADLEFDAPAQDGQPDLVAVDSEATPDVTYDKGWALHLLGMALDSVRSDYAKTNQEAIYDRLKSHLIGESASATYANLGVELDLSEAAVKKAISRLRKRFAAKFRALIADTVAPEDVEDELRYLQSVMGR